MALVSRSSLGKLVEPDQSDAPGSVPARGTARVPAAPPPCAVAVPTPSPGPGVIVLAFVFVVAGCLVAYALWWRGLDTAVIQPPDTATTFVVLLVFAAAVERLLEPFTRVFPGSAAAARVEQAKAAAANRGPEVTYDDMVYLARAEAEAERAKASRAVLLWGLATAVATVVSTICGFYLLHAVAGPSWNGIPTWADALVTGLVVGSGTKPVHDLVTMAQSKAK